MNDLCLYCDNELVAAPRGRNRKYCNSNCRVAYHRHLKRYKRKMQSVTEYPDLTGTLILELFPGAGLFGRSFSELGATVVNAGDIMWGYDVSCFRGLSGKFDGIIGGPPCQLFSRAARTGTNAVNLIPEFVRVVEECSPRWAIMENVREARPHAPQWDYVSLRDFDCGGLTHRRRGFWFYGMDAPVKPDKRQGEPEYSVLASNWNRRGENSKMHGHQYLSHEDASRLQGFPGLSKIIYDNQPGWKNAKGTYNGVSKTARRVIATHMMGNGVTRAMGLYLAKWVSVNSPTK